MEYSQIKDEVVCIWPDNLTNTLEAFLILVTNQKQSLTNFTKWFPLQSCTSFCSQTRRNKANTFCFFLFALVSSLFAYQKVPPKLAQRQNGKWILTTTDWVLIQTINCHLLHFSIQVYCIIFISTFGDCTGETSCGYWFYTCQHGLTRFTCFHGTHRKFYFCVRCSHTLCPLTRTNIEGHHALYLTS